MFETRLTKYDATMNGLGPVYTEHHRQRCVNSVMTLVVVFSLKTMESHQNGLQL